MHRLSIRNALILFFVNKAKHRVYLYQNLRHAHLIQIIANMHLLSQTKLTDTTTQSLCPLPGIIWPSTSTLIVCTRGDILEFQVLLFQGLLHRELGLSLLSNALLFHVSFHAFMHCLGTDIAISMVQYRQLY